MWVIMIDNPRQYVDPQEVVYNLVEINENNEVVATDGHITMCHHGWIKKLREALDNPFYERRAMKPIYEIKPMD